MGQEDGGKVTGGLNRMRATMDPQSLEAVYTLDISVDDVFGKVDTDVCLEEWGGMNELSERLRGKCANTSSL